MWLALLLVLLGALWGVGGPRRAGQAIARGLRRAAPGAWRPGAGLLSLAALLAALIFALRLDWLPALIAAAVGATLAAVSRLRGRSAPSNTRRHATMSRREAASLLGVDEVASPAQVQAAYARLIRRAHPDAGGTAGLAAQLNLARAAMLSS